MNEDKLIEVLVQVEREEALVELGRKTHQDGTPVLGFDMECWYSRCNTTACLAGHAVVLAGWMLVDGDNAQKIIRKKNGQFAFSARQNIEKLGKQVLELDDAQTAELFFLESLDAVYEWIAEEMGIDEQVLRDKVAAEARR